LGPLPVSEAGVVLLRYVDRNYVGIPWRAKSRHVQMQHSWHLLAYAKNQTQVVIHIDPSLFAMIGSDF
jgi:hypothetical protein